MRKVLGAFNIRICRGLMLSVFPICGQYEMRRDFLVVVFNCGDSNYAVKVIG